MPQGNQLKMDERYAIAKYLESNWEDHEEGEEQVIGLKHKTQADIALHLTDVYDRPISKQNVSSIMRMCGLKQDHQIGNTQMSREVAVAHMKLTYACYMILSSQYEIDYEIDASVMAAADKVAEFLGLDNTEEEEG